ncbi:hypothetical protein B9Z55_023117 [Caenorhabditis nigoni]|uniref:Uncharacterized protein n=1 Tax=Caenorhabditis nigoni TaxID=1611254 RepID=A0A2G5SNX0_9PELO|nr:hypothetical protein B9Z55_023117 [Caenorhabditis nigoni]
MASKWVPQGLADLRGRVQWVPDHKGRRGVPQGLAGPTLDRDHPTLRDPKGPDYHSKPIHLVWTTFLDRELIPRS